MKTDFCRRLKGRLVPFLAIAACVPSLWAHAILVSASPSAGSSITGPQASISLRFNSRIDAKRSSLTLVRPDNTTSVLAIDSEKSPDTLSALAKDLKPGTYKIRWQVLASDGHITRGDYAFEVK